MHFIQRVLSLAAVGLVIACNTVEPIQSVENAPVPVQAQQNASDDHIGAIIAAAAVNKGWQVDQQRPGLVHVTLHWNNYSTQAGIDAATSCIKKKCQADAHDSGVTILYTQQTYSLAPDPSPDDNLPSGLTYRQFNKYVERLRREIDKDLAQASHH